MSKVSYVLPIPESPNNSKLALYPALKFSSYFLCDLALNDDFSKEPIIYEKLKISQPIFLDIDPKLGQSGNFIVASVICEDSVADLNSTFLLGFFSTAQDEIISKCCRFVRNRQDFFLITKEPQEIHVINLEFLERSELDIQINNNELKLQFLKPYHKISVGSQATIASKAHGRYIYFFFEKKVAGVRILVPAT